MDVSAWLRASGFESLVQTFSDNDIDFDVLVGLTEGDLKELGVLSLGQRRKLLRAIAALEPATTKSKESHADQSSGPERRQLTLMFCDIVGSTELSSRLELEKLREVIGAYQQICIASIRDLDGFVAKFMGDGVLAYFGYPRAHEDDAARAVYAAMKLVAAIRQSPLQAEAPISVRIGIATGLVVVGELIGEGSAQEETVIGETPNLAARLQALADPDCIVVSSQTRALLASQFELSPLGTHTLKGFSEPVPAWKIVAESSNVSRFEAAHEGMLLPLVGRAHEAALLFDRWCLAVQGSGQVALLSGEAGIGKSRIAQELRERIRNEPHAIVRYQCSPHHANQPLYPAIDQIWHAAGLAQDEPAGARLDKLESLVRQSGLDSAEIVPLLAGLLSLDTQGRYGTLDLPPSVVRENTILALISLLAGLAESAPVLFLLEDAHWIDPTTLELTTRALDHLENLRVLSIITFRPEFSPPWTNRSNVTALALNRLARSQVISIVEGIAGGKPLPKDVVDQIVVKTDGVPLFVEELTKTVLQSGLLSDEGDAYVLAKAMTPLAIPSTVQDSLMARLDRLAPVKELAQIGAVIGREFSRRLLAEVAGVGQAILDAGLSQLVDAGLLFTRGSATEPSYIFKHALVQDTAYASLLRSRREQFHADIARALSEKFKDQSDTAPEIVAHHYTEAGLIAPALRHWVAAAEWALARSANIEGVRYAERGLQLVPKLADGDERQSAELSLLVARANGLLALRGYTAAETIDALNRVKKLLDAGLGNDVQRFSILYGLWAANYVAARVGEAQELGFQYLDVATRVADPTFSMIANRIVGAALIASGDHRRGLTYVREAVQKYEPEKHRPLSYRFGQDIGLSAICHEVWALWFMGEISRAKQLSAEILTQLPSHGHATTVAFCSLYGGLFPALFARDFLTVETLGRELTEFCETRRMGANYASAGRLCSGVAVALRMPAQADLDSIRRETEMLHGFGVFILESPINALVAELYLSRGDFAQALATLQSTLRFVETTREAYWLPELHRLQARCAQASNETAAVVERHFQAAIKVAREQGAVSLELRTQLDLSAFRTSIGLPILEGELRRLASMVNGDMPEVFAVKRLLGLEPSG